MVISGLLDSNQNGKYSVVHKKHQQLSIDANYTVHYTTPHLILHGMEKSQN